MQQQEQQRKQKQHRQRHTYLARPAAAAATTSPRDPFTDFDGLSSSPLIDPPNAARTRTTLTMERPTSSFPRAPTTSVTTPSTSHIYGQNHERKKPTGKMQMHMQKQQQLGLVGNAGCSVKSTGMGAVGSGARVRGVGLMLLSMLLVLSSLVAPATARTITYCSTVNSGSDYDSVINEFQSHGLCYDNCNAGSYSFAIVQGAYCWCSNYVPGVTEDVADCSEECPGYPSELCGNTQKNLYGYMTLANKPSGTKGAATTTKSATTSSTSDATTLTTKTTSSKSTATPTPKVTATSGSGSAVTSPTSSPSATSPPSSTNKGFFSNPGRTAGLVVGLLAALAFIVAGVVFWRRRQQRQHSELYGGPGSPAGAIPPGGAGVFGARTRTRSMSTLGLVGEKNMNSPTTGATVTPPTAPAGESTPGTVYDQRLDPSSLFMRFDHRTGSSRMSVRSLRDDTDYSRRVLRLANPDEP